MNLVKYDPKKHELTYDDEREEIIFLFGDDVDLSCKISKEAIARMNNVPVEPYGDDDSFYIDGEFKDAWSPSSDQLHNALCEVERNVFNPKFPYKLELNIDTTVILEHLRIVAFAQSMMLKVNFSQKELVMS